MRAWAHRSPNPRPFWRNRVAEFTGERLIPGEVDVDLLNEHVARYTFASRLARGNACWMQDAAPVTVPPNWPALP